MRIRCLPSFCPVYFLIVFFCSALLQAAGIVVETSSSSISEDGLCSLPEAIENANGDAAIHADCPAGSGPDTIFLTRDVLLDGAQLFPVDGPNGLPSISSELAIDGGGRSISRAAGSPAFRILHVSETGVVHLYHLTIENGFIDSGFDNGGGIYNSGDLTISDSTIQNNSVESIFPSGGGIYNEGILTISSSVIANNIATDDTFSSGGGVYNTFEAELNLTNAEIRSNSANRGGGILTSGPTTVQNSHFQGNTAREFAGALLLFATLEPSEYRIYNSRFEGNSAPQGGGAIVSGSDELEIFSSTFTGNRVTESGTGGALQNFGGKATITASVFEENQALAEAIGGAIGNLALGEINLIGSTIRNNTAETKGGGLFTQLAEFFVRDSLIVGNQAQFGGGLFQGGSNMPGFFVERSSIVENTALSFGGGVYAEGSLSTGQLVNSTVSNNQAPLFGAGIMLNMGGRIDVLHSAVVGNVSTDFINSVGGFNAFAGTTNIGSTIIAGNLNEDCSATNQSASLDYNITTGPSDFAQTRWCSFIPIQANDQTNTNPLVGPLAFNGNLGPTHLIQPGSPASDAIPFDCPSVLEGVDQRGVARPSGSCDVGPVTDEQVELPLVYFQLESSVINDEGTATGPHTVRLLVDNRQGTLATPAMDLNLYIGVRGSAAVGSDYQASLIIPTFVTIDPANWPAPGSIEVVHLDFTVIDDLLIEGNETIDLSVSLTGPGILGDRIRHTVSIIDDDQLPYSCEGFLPPFEDPRRINWKSEATIPVKMRIFDGAGQLVTPADLAAPPEIFVDRDGWIWGNQSDDMELIPVGKSNNLNLFAYDEEDQFWIYRLSTEQFPAAGTYTVSVRSGDPEEYTIDTDFGRTCTQVFTRK